MNIRNTLGLACTLLILWACEESRLTVNENQRISPASENQQLIHPAPLMNNPNEDVHRALFKTAKDAYSDIYGISMKFTNSSLIDRETLFAWVDNNNSNLPAWANERNAELLETLPDDKNIPALLLKSDESGDFTESVFVMLPQIMDGVKNVIITSESLIDPFPAYRGSAGWGEADGMAMGIDAEGYPIKVWYYTEDCQCTLFWTRLVQWKNSSCSACVYLHLDSLILYQNHWLGN